MPYTFLRIEKGFVQGSDTLYVAVIQKEGELQPYRVVLTPFQTTEEARGQVDTWISTQSEDDARAAANKATEALIAKEDLIMDEINKTIV